MVLLQRQANDVLLMRSPARAMTAVCRGDVFCCFESDQLNNGEKTGFGLEKI